MTNAPTSQSLLRRVQTGAGEESWHEFVTFYDQLIQGWLRRQGVKANDAEDVRQEVLAVVLKEIGRFEHNGRTGAFRNWLRTVTANRLRDFWRARKRQKTAGEADLEELARQLDDATSDLSRIWNHEHDRKMLECLMLRVSKQFAPKSMQAFRQVVIEQRPIDDVSDELELTINAIRVAQSRILRALRKEGAGLLD
ncbi:MAG: sigma-70 family RNA polymerase sigma factor [Planctomycetota bacterium]